MGLLRRFDLTLDDVFTYRIEKTVDVQVWQVGVFYRACQTGILAYLVLSVFLRDTWAYSEVPTSLVNAWAEEGAWRGAIDARNFESRFVHCGNASYDFIYSDTFRMVNAVCVADSPYACAAL